MQKSANKCICWDLGDDLGSKNLPKSGQKSVKLDKNQSWGRHWKNICFFYPKWTPNGAKMELNLSKNWVKIEANKNSQNLTILSWFLMIFGDICWWFLKPLIETAKMEKPSKTIVFTVYFGGTSLQKSLKIVKKLNRKSYHPKVIKSDVF